MPTGSKYTHLLEEDKDIKRWYDNLEAKSVITATVYLRTLGLYFDTEKTTPKKILAEASSKSFRDDFTDFIRRLEKERKVGSYIERFKKVILSWTSYNNLDVKLKVNIKGASDTPTIANERVPSKDALARILRMASTRGRVSIAMIAFSGLRPESLGDYLETDSIRLGDFTEAKISAKGVEFGKVPTTVIVRRALSKARHPYFTFVDNESIAYIEEYLHERVKQGEKLTPQSPLLAFDLRGV